MKKCASCTKDLPDAALHCVFCGAKQPPAPATSGGMAKTVMGYSANEMIEQIKQQNASSRPNPAPAPAPAPAPYQPPRPQPAPAPMSGGPGAMNNNPMAGAYGSAPPMANPMGGANQVPPAGNMAPTMFVGGPAPNAGPAPMGHNPMNPPMGGPGGGNPMGAGPQARTQIAPAPMQSQPAGMHQAAMQPSPMQASPMQASPMQPMAPQPMMQQPHGYGAPIPAVQTPSFLPGTTAARAGRPIEPWKDSLRMMMFIWGGVLLAAFALPLTIDPLTFQWDTIANAEGTAKLPPLILAAVGLLSIALAAIPTSPAPRGMMALLLGLAGIYVPMFLDGVPPWQMLLVVGGTTILVPGLLLRSEYRESIAPRIMCTVGALAVLAIFVIPVRDEIPLVLLFKGIIDAPAEAKILAIVPIGFMTVLVLSLLAWLPSPSTGAGKPLAWVLIVFPAIGLLAFIAVANVFDKLPDAPGTILTWAHSPSSSLAGLSKGKGGAELGAVMMMMGMSVAAGYAVLVGYGGATIIGKKLE